jgi:hypothetical protein
MKKQAVSKLRLSRETVAHLGDVPLWEEQLRLIAGGTARTACGSCPALSCEGTRCCSPTT